MQHKLWLASECQRLLDFGRAARLPGAGFGWLDTDGRPTPGEPQHLYITGRLTHSYSLGALLGVPGCRPVAEHGVRALTGLFHDDEHGGWYPALDEASAPLDTAKGSYPLSFVVLAGASASIAGVDGAQALLERSVRLVEDRFWDEDNGAVVETWDRAFTELSDYRGLNSNMHMLEALLAAYSASGDATLLERCVSISRLAVDAARAHDWRLPEHFDTAWRPLLDFNSERRDDPFRPYGATIGHSLEWARLLLQLESAFTSAPPPAWLREAAVALFDRAVTDGWQVDGREGFVYTVDWQGRPAVRNRLHWVVTEAIGAAATLHAVTGEERYLRWYHAWWDHARELFIDVERGSWHHELDEHNRPAATIKKGKADVYHTLQATIVPRVPVRPGIARAVVDATV